MEIPLFLNIILCIILVLVVGLNWKKNQRESRITHYRNRQRKRIQQGKILIAIQPIDIFVEISNTRKERFIELQIERSGVGKIVYFIKKMFGLGAIYYRIKDKKHNNIAFVQSLLQTKRVELFLYTTLQEQIAQILLKKLDLTKYFSPDRRRFCYGASQELKHPTQIDSNIKRVIIITGSKHDHTDEDSEYFLVVKNKPLKLFGKPLTDLIMHVDNIDQLHNEFVHWKIDLQSDYESSNDKSQ